MDDAIKLLIAESYVNDIKKLRYTIDTCQHEIERLRAQADGLKSVVAGDKVDSTSDVHKLDDITYRLTELIKIYTVDLSVYLDQYHTAHTCMIKLPGIQSEALIRHYLWGDTWEQIRIDTNYSYDRMMQIRKDGITNLFDLLPYSVREDCRSRIIPRSM